MIVRRIRDCNKPEVTERKGKLAGALFLKPSREEAETIAGSLRDSIHSVRIYERNIKVDGLELGVWVVVCRKKVTRVKDL